MGIEAYMRIADVFGGQLTVALVIVGIVRVIRHHRLLGLVDRRAAGWTATRYIHASYMYHVEPVINSRGGHCGPRALTLVEWKKTELAQSI